jgi:curved DNA-binding protein CbpA
MDFRDWLKNDYYNLLGINQDASDEEINKAYRSKAKKTHPDIFPINSSERKEAEEKFKKLLLARDTLLNKEKREEYDRERQVIQEQYINYISATSFTKIEKKEENNKKTFSKILEDLVNKNSNISAYKKEQKNNYVKNENYDIDIELSDEEKEIISKHKKARNFYDLGIRAMRYGDNRGALMYFKSAKMLDSSLKIPILYYWRNI